MGIVAESVDLWKPKATRCPWQAFYDEILDDADRKVVDQWLEVGVSPEHVARRLRSVNLTIAEGSIRRHKTGTCSCRG